MEDRFKWSFIEAVEVANDLLRHERHASWQEYVQAAKLRQRHKTAQEQQVAKQPEGDACHMNATNTYSLAAAAADYCIVNTNTTIIPIQMQRIADNLLWWMWNQWWPAAEDMAKFLMHLAQGDFETALALQRQAFSGQSLL